MNTGANVDNQVLNQPTQEKVQAIQRVLEKNVEGVKDQLTELIRDGNQMSVVIRGNNGRVILRTRLSIAMFYILALVGVRRLRWVTLMALPMLLSHLEFVIEPVENDKTDDDVNMAQHSRRRKSSDRAD